MEFNECQNCNHQRLKDLTESIIAISENDNENQLKYQICPHCNHENGTNVTKCEECKCLIPIKRSMTTTELLIFDYCHECNTNYPPVLMKIFQRYLQLEVGYFGFKRQILWCRQKRILEE